MNEAEIATLIGRIKPLGVTTLFCLWTMPRPLFETEIARLCGVHRHTIADVTPLLALHGYASKIGTPPRWTLTDRGRQIDLPGMSKISTSGSSSSIVVIEGEIQNPSQQLLQQPGMSKNWTSGAQLSTIAPHPDRRRLIEFLISDCGVEARKEAEKAIDTALEEDHPLDIEERALYWLAYLKIGTTWKPDSPGIFIARKVENGEDAPNTFELHASDYRIAGLCVKIAAIKTRREKLLAEAKP